MCGWVINPGVVGTVTDEADVGGATVVVTDEVVVVTVVDGSDAGGLIAVWLPLFTVWFKASADVFDKDVEAYVYKEKAKNIIRIMINRTE